MQYLGGGYWENKLGDHMENDDPANSRNDIKTTTIKLVGRTMHTEVKMYGLKFSKDW